MLLDFRCEGCGAEFERLVARGSTSSTCKCGGTAQRRYSGFAIKQYRVDRSNWAMVAPLGADGKPMTLREAQKSREFDGYNPSEEARERARTDAQREQRYERMKQEAISEAWAETSKRRRIEVRG